MLHKETVANSTLELLKRLMADNTISDFFLAGGTVLALQIGHRESVDLDLFSVSGFDAALLSQYLSKEYSLFKMISTNTLKGECEKTAVDIITHAYPLVNELITEEGVRIASLEDIAAMKLNAIVSNGTRLKDFVDIAFLSSKFPLQKMSGAYEKKYKMNNPIIPIKALGYFDDIVFDVQINYKQGKPTWEQIKARINQMIKNPAMTFPPLTKGLKP